VETGDNQAKFRVRSVDYECFNCGAKHSLRLHKIEIGQVIKCKCGAKAKMEGVCRLVRLDGGAGTGQ
jgi:DNA-directed RNA polymerase subunit RPC12/RpoP